MFGSCFNRNDIFSKPKMFDNIPDWLDRLKSITDYQITKWDNYENTKQDKISAIYPILFNNNNLSFADNYVMDIVRPSLTAVSESCSNAISGFLSGLESMFVTRNDVNNIIDDILDTRLDRYDETIYLKQQWDNDINLFTYSKVNIQKFLADKQGTLTFGKGIRVEPGDELSVNIERELAIKRYFDIDKHVYDDRANKDEEEEESIETVMNLDEFEDIIGYQAFTVKNLLRVLYNEDTKTYKLTVPYTNRLVDADYAISSRTILRELRSEYEKKIFALGDSVQLVNIDWFIKKFRDAYEGDTRIGRQDYSDPSKISNDDIRTAFFRTNVDYPLLKTDFEGWYETEFGPTAVNHLTDLVTDMYQRAIIVNSSGTLDKYADGSVLGENYWRTTLADQTHLKYLYTTDGTTYFTPDEYSTSSTFEVKQKIVELHNRIDSLDVTEVGGTNKYISAISETDGKISATAGNIDTSVTSNSDNLITSGAVAAAIDELPEPMIFKGSVGSGGTVEWANLPSPSSSNKGWTYKAITDNNTEPICKAGDTIISDSTTWVVIPSGDEPSGTVTNVAIQGETNYIEVSGSPITSNGTITITAGQTIKNKRDLPTTLTTFSGSVAENTNYILSTAISSLTISSIANSNLESNIIFEVTGSSFSITFPANTPMIGNEPTYESGEKYIVSICNGIVIVAPITA